MDGLMDTRMDTVLWCWLTISPPFPSAFPWVLRKLPASTLTTALRTSFHGNKCLTDSYSVAAITCSWIHNFLSNTLSNLASDLNSAVSYKWQDIGLTWIDKLTHAGETGETCDRLVVWPWSTLNLSESEPFFGPLGWKSVGPICTLAWLIQLAFGATVLLGAVQTLSTCPSFLLKIYPSIHLSIQLSSIYVQCTDRWTWFVCLLLRIRTCYYIVYRTINFICEYI